MWGKTAPPTRASEANLTICRDKPLRTKYGYENPAGSEGGVSSKEKPSADAQLALGGEEGGSKRGAVLRKDNKSFLQLKEELKAERS